MLMWVAGSADTTGGTTPTTTGSSKVGFTRNLASVSRMVLAPSSLAMSQAYPSTTSGNDRCVVRGLGSVAAHQLALDIDPLSGIERAVCAQLPGCDLGRHRTLKHVVEHAARLGIADPHQRIDPSVKIAMHQVGATDPELVVAARPKAQNPGVLKKAAENAAHPNVVGQPDNTRPQRTHATHDQIDMHSRL